MNEREVSELRRRFRADKTNITRICGCYVSDKGEILSQFTTSISLMLDDEKEKGEHSYKLRLFGVTVRYVTLPVHEIVLLPGGSVGKSPLMQLFMDV